MVPWYSTYRCTIGCFVRAESPRPKATTPKLAATLSDAVARSSAPRVTSQRKDLSHFLVSDELSPAATAAVCVHLRAPAFTTMSDYQAFDGDDAYSVVVNGINAVVQNTRTMRSKLGVMESRDTPALRSQIEELNRKTQDAIAEVKAELSGGSDDTRVANAERQFRDACSRFRDTFAEYKRLTSKGTGRQATISGNELATAGSDSWRGDGGGLDRDGGGGSQQSLKLVATDDVNDIMERENMEDAMQLASDTVKIREVMTDIGTIIQQDGDALMNINEDIEQAADTAEQAAEELVKAREHQKSHMKLKIAISVCCGVTLLTVLFVLLAKFGVFTGGKQPFDAVGTGGATEDAVAAPAEAWDAVPDGTNDSGNSLGSDVVTAATTTVAEALRWRRQ
jgi:hypothetical protein